MIIEQGLGPFECVRPVADQITTERLQEAQIRLMEFANFRPPEVLPSLELAKRLYGLSDAVSDIVVARGTISTVDLTETPGYDPDVLPPVLPQNSFERYYGSDAPAPELAGRTLMATPRRHIGATLGLHNGGGSERQMVCEVILPTNEDIERLMSEPCQSWNDLFIRMQDFRSGQDAYPFHYGKSSCTAPQEYVEVARELSAYFVATSVPERV